MTAQPPRALNRGQRRWTAGRAARCRVGGEDDESIPQVRPACRPVQSLPGDVGGVLVERCRLGTNRPTHSYHAVHDAKSDCIAKAEPYCAQRVGASNSFYSSCVSDRKHKCQWSGRMRRNNNEANDDSAPGRPDVDGAGSERRPWRTTKADLPVTRLTERPIAVTSGQTTDGQTCTGRQLSGSGSISARTCASRNSIRPRGKRV